MLANDINETLQIPELHIPNLSDSTSATSRSNTPSQRRRRFKMRRSKAARNRESADALDCSGNLEYLQLPSIEITPSSDEDSVVSNSSTPSTSPRRHGLRPHSWCGSSAKNGCEVEVIANSESRLFALEAPEIPWRRRKTSWGNSTASNSNRSSPACSPVLRKRSRSPTPQQSEGEAMVEKSSDHSSDKSPPTPEPGVQRSGSSQSGRSGGKNSKKSQSWYNHERQHIRRVLSPTYKQRNEDFRKLFKQLPDTERLIVDYSCALQRDILLQGRLYLSENWICFYSNIFRWETLLTVRLKDICSMTKEKTARLIPNAIQLCTDTEKHFFTSFGARDRTYMMMFRLWQNALLEKPLCPKELWHFVHQCYGNELGLTSDDEDYVPPDDDFNTMGYCEEIPVEEVEVNDNSSKSSSDKPESNCNLQDPSLTSSNVPSTASSEAPTYDGPLLDDIDSSLEREMLIATLEEQKVELLPPVTSPSLDFNDNEDLPTELSDSSETHDEGEVQAFYEDLNGRQYINEVFSFNVDKLFGLLFAESQFLREFMEQRRFTEVIFHPWKKEENGNQTRVVLYTIMLTNPLAPKSATVTETQTLYKASQESECYVVDAEVLTHDIPYHDYFYTINRYTLTRVARNKSRLRISTELRYRKQPWGLVKTFIEKNFWSGLDEYFHHLENELTKAETAYLSTLHRESPKEKITKIPSTRRRKRPHTHLRIPHLQEVLSPVTTPTDEERVHHHHHHHVRHVAGHPGVNNIGPDCLASHRENPLRDSQYASLGNRMRAKQGYSCGESGSEDWCSAARLSSWQCSTQTRHVPEEKQNQLQSISKLLLVISCVLVLLVLLNVMLFYKLWMLEYSTQALSTWQGLRLQESPLPQTQAEWTQLLESQQKHHDTELQKWRQIVKSSVILLDQMKDSLINLQNGIVSRDFVTDSEDKPYQ
ncbi:protein Aster-B isoform X3 [Hyperolius riggenbachi]|uniref:protein Aster-B isoform X3 n=1 Tax=Hyperolius riggenbachi TaxID=752182 RepID=UPI0035A2C7B9